MTDDTFIRTILAAPDDDGPRLVYADYLEEQGDSERAELIRVQCELDAKWSGKCLKRPMSTREAVPLWSCCVVCDLRRRERQLLLARGFDWLPKVGIKPSLHDGGETEGVNFEIATTTLRGSGIQCDFVRGFVGKISCPWSDWLAHADAVLAACPIQDVTLTTMPDVHQDMDSGKWELAARRKTAFGRFRLVVDHSAFLIPIGDLLHAEWPSVKNWHFPPVVRESSRRSDLRPILIDPRFVVRGTA